MFANKSLLKRLQSASSGPLSKVPDRFTMTQIAAAKSSKLRSLVNLPSRQNPTAEITCLLSAVPTAILRLSSVWLPAAQSSRCSLRRSKSSTSGASVGAARDGQSFTALPDPDRAQFNRSICKAFSRQAQHAPTNVASTDLA